MKDKISQMNPECRSSTGSKNDYVQSVIAENERLKGLFSKMTDTMTWGNSVIKVVFRDEFFEEKYRLKIENFLREILDTDETFILTPQVFDKAEQEFKTFQDALQSEKSQKPPPNAANANNIPLYSSEFEDVLHCDEPELEEQIDVDKPPTMTCFNCLGDHHMNQCPEKIDRLRVAENKQDMMSENSSRYHEEEKRNAMKPGNISCDLRVALGLQSDQLPQYIYAMRVIGYPPGWMHEAQFETSGLALYDGQGNATPGDEPEDLSDLTIKYDSSKFVEYPGFNCPVPSNFKDEWKSFGMLPIQPRHQLSETIKSENIFNKLNMYKRKSSANSDDGEESKRMRNGTNDNNETRTDSPPENSSTPKKTECATFNSCNGTPIEKSLGASISQSPGTPILKQGNPFERLPEADKFAQGITEHLPFENLPESVGKFDKIRGVLSDVQKKLQNIKKNS